MFNSDFKSCTPLAYISADESMARVPKVAREKIFLARGIHCCPNFFSLTNLAIL
jgi:hypothetical protein